MAKDSARNPGAPPAPPFGHGKAIILFKLRWVVVLVAVTMGSAADATTRYVNGTCGSASWTGLSPVCAAPDGPKKKIQLAIADPATVDGDEIVVAAGIYNETINFNGKAITVRCTDPTDPAVVAATIIDGTGFFHVVQCISGEGPFTVLNGFTITGGNATGLHPDNAGGGMYNISDSSPTVANCTFSGNSAALNGGGMYNTLLSSPTVTDCTFSGNDATDDGGGMYNNNNNSNPTVTNCILWGDTAVGSGNEIFNDGTSGPMFSFSDIEGSGGSAAWDASVGTDGGDNIDADPLFVNEPGGDLRLSAGSPAIDAADNTAVPEGITTDLDGNPRFIDDPATVDTGDGVCHVDIGAYEFQDGAVVCFPGDINGDGAVSVPDLLILLAAWGPCPAPCPPSCPADIDSDCAVSVPDLLILLANWG